jgi:cytochrome c-type biogenesis protein CcmI
VSLLLSALGLAAVAAGFVVYPLLMQRWSTLVDAVSGHVLDRESRRRVALAALKEVEYDHVSGKLDRADYLDMKARLEREALAAIQLEEAAVTAADAAPITHPCGFTNPAGSRFCAGCGKRLA